MAVATLQEVTRKVDGDLENTHGERCKAFNSPL